MSLRRVDDRERAVCGRCGFVAYRNPVPAAGVVVVEAGKVLLVQRKFEPRAGLWTLPAGFVEYDEHVETCAVREAHEETGLEVALDGLFGAYMAMDDPRVQVVLLLYRAHRTGGEVRAGDDAADAQFFPIDAVPDEARNRAKAVNFGIIYGQGPYGLSRQTGMTVEQARTFIDMYFMRYPGIRNFIDHCIAEARDRGYATTILGRRRPVPQLHATQRAH